MCVNASARPLKSLLVGLIAVALLTSGCSASGDDDGPPSYEKSEAVSATVLPQLAAVGEDTESADDAAWVVDVVAEGVDAGTPVVLMAESADGGWDTLDEAETDDEGAVTLTSTAAGDIDVVVGDGDGAIGTQVSTTEAPAPTFTDDFDSDTVDVTGGNWGKRDQGHIGVRTCSRADASGTEVADGVLQLSVLDDPDKDLCQPNGKRKKFPFRLNGHVGSEGIYEFTYGFAAARIRTQSARGQHSAFWLQASGGQTANGAKDGGAEIDVMEYFGDDHPQGGLTSFTYWVDESGKKQTRGGWVPDLADYGSDWADEFHVFSVEWTPEEYVFRIDGQVTHRLEGETSGREEFLILSLLSSDYELPLMQDRQLPQHMYVDWVRVWETGGGN